MTDPLQPEPHSIAYWREIASEGPDRALANWNARLTKYHQRPGWKEAMAWLPSDDELLKAWEQAPSGFLQGVPWVLKDLFDVAGVPTTASSRFLETLHGLPEVDGAIVSDLKTEGGVLTGKTHLNEFAYGLDGVNPHFGTVPNPVLEGRLAGGSSSGSVWAVASGVVPFAVGTDTGGSIRVPSAFCGLYGLRLVPEHRWISDGCFPLSHSFDTAGWFTRTGEDMSALLSLFGSSNMAISEVRPEGLNLVAAYQLEPALAAVMTAETEGWSQTATPSELDEWEAATDSLVGTFNILQSSEALDLHRDWLYRYKEQYDPATWARIFRAENWSEEQKEAAAARADKWRNTLADWIEAYGFVVLPTSPSLPPKLSQGMESSVREGILAMTSPASLGGHPVLSIPVGSAPDTLTAAQVVLPKSLDQAIPLAKCILKATTGDQSKIASGR
jgi:amidase/aspartyl-tRNA(Asn)/glutamyl-tRNA(Gln) amidotransferase subunit A